MEDKHMEIVAFRERWLEELRVLCNRALRWDTFSEWTMRRCTIGDPNFDPDYALVALEGSKPVGLMLGVRRTKAPPEWVERDRETGWIKLFCVDPEHPDKVFIENEMLKELEEKFMADGVKVLKATNFASWHFFSGIDVRYEDQIGFLSSRGFRKEAEHVDYELGLLEFTVPNHVKRLEEDRTQEGYVFRKPGKNAREGAVNWVCKYFSPGWGYETNEGFRFDKPKIWLAEKDAETVGFSVYGALEPHWFGPIGVLDAHRKKGLGTVLLFKTLFSMREEGQRLVVIPWTGHLFFYSQVPGIRRIRHFWTMAKELK